MGHDLLDPGRSRLRSDREDDVVVAEDEVAPERGVELFVEELAGPRSHSVLTQNRWKSDA